MTETMVFDIAERIIQHITTINTKGQQLQNRLRQVVLDNFGWDTIAKRYVDYFSVYQ